MPRTTRHIPGVPTETERALNEVISQLSARLEALEAKPNSLPTQRSNFTAHEGQTITVEPPAAGINCTIVQSTRFNKGARITFVQKNASPVTFRAVSGTVNGLAFVVSNSRGTYEAISDGEGGWALNQNLGATGSTGAAGSAGPSGPPGSDGADGADGPPGSAGPAGAAGSAGSPGANGAAGPAGPPGDDGSEGPEGPPGPAGVNGTPGVNGATGAQGPPGDNGSDGNDGSPGPAGSNGATGLQGPIPPPPGIVLDATNESLEVVSVSTATLHFSANANDATTTTQTPVSQIGSGTSGTNQLLAAPAASTQRTMFECSIFNTDTAVANQVSVQRNTGGVLRTLIANILLFSNERLEFTADMGWRVFDSQGRERKIGQAPTLIVQPGGRLGVSILDVTAGPARALTAAQSGEDIRFDTVAGDTTTGTALSLAAITPDVTKYRKSSGATSLTVLGIAAPAVSGQRLVIGVDGTASVANFLLRDNEPTAASGDRLKLPHNQGVLLTPGTDATIEYTSARWHMTSHTGFPLEQRLLCRDDFTGGLRDSAGGIGETGWGIVSSVDAGASCTLTTGESGHPGVLLITGSSVGATAKVGIQKAGDNSGSAASCVCPGDVIKIEMVIKTGAIVTNMQMSGGLVDSPLITGNAGSLGAALAYYDSSLGTTWRLALRSAAGTITTTDTGVTVSAATWYYFILRRGAGGSSTWGLTVGSAGALSTEVTQSTDAPTNTTPLKMWVGIHKQTSAAAHSMSVDLFDIVGTPARF